ncbi:MAG: hypothetical protein GF317_22830 [Candidatus Lokiarchaeota archaeon]|nr:hypothetical protein [Candidatus Lokiarchaeota archaeon]MBD3202282.1 hypothetical protein [Candidatus Lokiarchaeota archaeon]
MKGIDKIIALFYSDENNLVFDKVKNISELNEDEKIQLKSLPFKYLGPVFFSGANPQTKNWIIDLVESTLTLKQEKTKSPDMIQSFFLLNSSIRYKKKVTNLFCLVGSPYNEDRDVIYKKMNNYIHPSIIQGKLINESIYGEDLDYREFVLDELDRGINLIEHSLGSQIKSRWKLQKKYFCVGFIKRSYDGNTKSSELYTFDTNYLYKDLVLDFIPSFYIMCILPDYYESRIDETLKLFGKHTINPHISTIKIHQKEKEVLYMEEYKMEKEEKISYGVILIPESKKIEYLKETSVFVPEEDIDRIPKNLSFFKKAQRQLLNGKREIYETILEFNPNINPVEPWPINSEESLKNIQIELDVKKNQ